MRKLKWPLLLLAIVSVSLPIHVAAAPLDHFLCYTVKSSKGSPKFKPVIGLPLADQFEEGSFDVKKPEVLCVPAQKNGEVVLNPDIHLKGYDIKLSKGEPKHVPQRNVIVVNQFGGITVDTRKPDRLLVPSLKSLGSDPGPPDPATHNVDHFKCYTVKLSKGAQKFPKGLRKFVVDQFAQGKVYDITRPTRLCVPVAKGEEEIKKPQNQLMCYAVKAAKGEPKHEKLTRINVNNQFGAEVLDTLKEQELCVPPPNQPPNAVDDTATTTEDTPVNINVLANDTDPDGDLLTVVGVTQGAHGAAVINANGTVTYTPGANFAGFDTFTYTISDEGGLTDTATVTVTVTGVNDAPVLNPVGDKTVSLGSTLTVQLSATDVDGGPLTFLASPLPLPANAGLHRTTGKFTFSPAADQVGTTNLTFTVSDGSLTASETIVITVPPPGPAGVTAISGRILDSNTFKLGQTEPVVGATVSILGSGKSAVSDVNGNFMVTGVPSGSQIFDINAATASPAPDGSPYAGFREDIDLISGVTNIIERPFFLPRISAPSLTAVDPNTTTIVTNPDMGVTLTIPPNTAKDENGNNFVGQLSISEVPRNLAPVALPDFLDPSMLITIQPVGVTFSTPVLITFPNVDNFPPGTETDIWSLDANRGIFTIVGTGKVSTDGTKIETIAGGIRAATWHGTLPPPTPVQPRDPGPSENSSKDCPTEFGSTVSLQNGCLGVEFSPPSYRSLGVSRSLNFVYKSKSASPHPVIPFHPTILKRAAVPPLTSYKLSVAGIDQGVETFVDTSGLREDRDETIRNAVAFDGSGFNTGFYPYSITVTSNYAQSRSSSTLRDRVIVVNEQKSAFGAGWGIENLRRLHFNSDGSILETRGNGRARVFEPGGPVSPVLTEDFSAFDISKWVVNGNAFVDTAQGNFVLTPAGASQRGRLFFATPFRTARFKAEFDYTISGGTGGEGLTFAVVRSPTYSVNTGRCLDFCGASGFAVEFDTSPSGGSDPAGPHIAIVEDSTDVHLVSVPQQTRGPHHVIIDFNNGIIKVSFDGAEVIDFDIPGFRTFNGFFGFTAATGSATTDNHIIDNFVLSLPGPNTNIFVVRAGAEEFFALVRNADGTFTNNTKSGTKINFNALGLQTSVVDRNGNRTTYSYDGNSRLSSITDPVGLVTSFAYSGGLLSSVTDPAGRITTFNHDAAGNLIKVTFPDGSSKSFGYDSRHLMTSETDERGFTVQREYDSVGRPVKVTFPDGSTRAISPAQTAGFVDPSSGLGTRTNPAPVVRPGGAVNVLTDGRGNQSTVGTTRSGAPTRITDGLGRITRISRVNGNPTQITLPNGAVITNTFDRNDNLLSSTDPLGATTTFTYEPNFNQVTSTTDPKGNLTQMSYDAAGNLIGITDALGNNTQMTYDTRGLPLSVTSAAGTPIANTSIFAYDARGNLATATDPLGNVTTLTYDSTGNVKTAADAEGRVTTFNYDAMNRLTSVLDPDLKVTSYTYDAKGNLTQVTDANNQITSFTYDVLDRLSSSTNPLGLVESFAYDANGNLTSTTNRNGDSITFAYDALNRLDQKARPPTFAEIGPQVVTTFSFDAVGNLTSVVDPNSTVNMAYDLANRLTSTTVSSPFVLPQTISYAYDLNGNRTSMTDPQAGLTTYAYDVLNRLTSITNPSAQVTSFTYDAIGRRTSMTHTNGVVTTHTYDAASQLLSLVHQLGATTINGFTYSYDKVGNRKTKADRNGTASYTYDTLNRLVEAINPLPTNPLESFAYNAVGNRTTSNQNGASIFNAANQLEEDAIFRYLYDANGNLTRKTNKTTGEITQFEYTAENQLVRVVTPGNTVNYKYDGLRRRIEKEIVEATTTVTRYIYDNGDILLELDKANNIVARYTHGPGIDEPLVMEKGGASFFYHADALGSITEITDSTGVVKQRYSYSSFGKIESQLDPNFVQPYTFTAREFDSESGLYFYRTRTYDPTTGRFLQQDPLGFTGEQVNLYLYVNNNPIKFTDPTGLRQEKPSAFWEWLKIVLKKAVRAPPGTKELAGAAEAGVAIAKSNIFANDISTELQRIATDISLQQETQNLAAELFFSIRQGGFDGIGKTTKWVQENKEKLRDLRKRVNKDGGICKLPRAIDQ